MAQRKTATSSGKRRRSQPAREPSPGDYAREAVAQWRQAFHHAVAAVSSRRETSRGKRDGGRLGDAVDALLAKAGRPGKVASRLRLGNRAVARLRGGGNGARPSESAANADAHAPVPIQESIEVAVAPKVAYALCQRFDEYPAFLERVQDVEELDDGTLAFDVRVRGTRRRVAIAIVDERANRRIDWESVEGPEHVGRISFHPLAPGLTHIELSVDLVPHGLVERFTRTVHLTEHAIRADLQRFKAYAELWEEDETEEEESEAAAEPATSA